MNAAAQKLLENLATTRRAFAGQHDYITSGTRYRDEITRLTGRAPSIFGSDFSFIYRGINVEGIGHCGPSNLTEPGCGMHWQFAPGKIFAPESTQTFFQSEHGELEAQRTALVDRCIRLHQEGVMITLMWHAPRPGCGDLAGDGDLWVSSPPPDSFWSDFFDSASHIHADWCAQVDRVAAHLVRLRDAGVPVIWRPYHEMNGAWFWWGNQPEHFCRLWHMLRQRMQDTHHLDNLLWVWNPNAPRDTPGDEAGAYADYYPGGDVVDVLAADVYHNDFRDSHHDDLHALAGGRPIALGEVAHLPSQETLSRQPHWAWIMPWGGLVFRFNRTEAIRSLYSKLP